MGDTLLSQLHILQSHMMLQRMIDMDLLSVQDAVKSVEDRKETLMSEKEINSRDEEGEEEMMRKILMMRIQMNYSTLMMNMFLRSTEIFLNTIKLNLLSLKSQLQPLLLSHLWMSWKISHVPSSSRWSRQDAKNLYLCGVEMDRNRDVTIA